VAASRGPNSSSITAPTFCCGARRPALQFATASNSTSQRRNKRQSEALENVVGAVAPMVALADDCEQPRLLSHTGKTRCFRLHRVGAFRKVRKAFEDESVKTFVHLIELVGRTREQNKRSIEFLTGRLIVYLCIAYLSGPTLSDSPYLTMMSGLWSIMNSSVASLPA